MADQNLTGYAQVLDELQNTAVPRTYSYGLELTNETQTLSGALTTSFYGFDGHGSFRFLTDPTGAVTDTYDYDAFGILISQRGPRPTTICSPASSSIRRSGLTTTGRDITTSALVAFGRWTRGKGRFRTLLH